MQAKGPDAEFTRQHLTQPGTSRWFGDLEACFDSRTFVRRNDIVRQVKQFDLQRFCCGRDIGCVA